VTPPAFTRISGPDKTLGRPVVHEDRQTRLRRLERLLQPFDKTWIKIQVLGCFNDAFQRNFQQGVLHSSFLTFKGWETCTSAARRPPAPTRCRFVPESPLGLVVPSRSRGDKLAVSGEFAFARVRSATAFRAPVLVCPSTGSDVARGVAPIWRSLPFRTSSS
jgi:hypothetical protein